MATISFDGRSFSIDGRRIWLVSGSIHYARVPRELWAQRIEAARQAGLNCVCTDVFWNFHESSPDEFTFEGQADLRHFVELIAAAGMYCILRPGPYVGGGWDFGGLPPWLTTVPGMRLRQASRHDRGFLEASARYLGAVMEQVRDLQLSMPPRLDQEPASAGGGPILLVQAEHEWCCHHPIVAQAYLGEIVRFLRENGCTVPICLGNNFWQRIDGAFDTWSADEHLATDLRQMQLVQPDAPRLVSELQCSRTNHWHHRWPARDAHWCLNRLAQVLSSGAQYNVHMFHGGTNFGFYGGRLTDDDAAYATTSHDSDAPVSEAGARTDKYRAVKRISTFASQFDHVLAHAEPGGFHTAICSDQPDHPPSVIHQRGAQGDIVFILNPPSDKPRQIELMLPEGLRLPVPLCCAGVTWLLFKANLGGVAELTYSNLCPWAFVDSKMLVLFGPAGAEGLVGINDAPLSVRVPSERRPLIEKHEGMTIVVLNEQSVDAATLAESGVMVGAAGLDAVQAPIPLEGWSRCTSVSVDGKATSTSVRRPRHPAAPRLRGWRSARTTAFTDGTSSLYERIDGPQSLEQLGMAYGYGWYRVSFKQKLNASIMAPQAADRLHLYADGVRKPILGTGPGAQQDPIDLHVNKHLAVLADNLGRFDDGWMLGERKGLFGHLYAVKRVAPGRPKVEKCTLPDPFDLDGFLRDLRHGERQQATALSWRVKSIGTQPLIVDLRGFPQRAMLVVNGSPAALYDPKNTAGTGTILLEAEKHLRRRPNDLRLVLFARTAKPPVTDKTVRVYQATQNVTARAQWAFARWSAPADDAFEPTAGPQPSTPAWHRCAFEVVHADVPLWLEPAGMSKGQIFLNGHNVGRYLVAAASRRKDAAPNRCYLPEPWLRDDGPNELTIFDELGNSPAKCRLAYDA